MGWRELRTHSTRVVVYSESLIFPIQPGMKVPFYAASFPPGVVPRTSAQSCSNT